MPEPKLRLQRRRADGTLEFIDVTSAQHVAAVRRRGFEFDPDATVPVLVLGRDGEAPLPKTLRGAQANAALADENSGIVYGGLENFDTNRALRMRTAYADEEARLGGAFGMAVTGVTNAGAALTFGGTSALARQIAGDEATTTQRDLNAANPGTALAGTIGGIALPMLATGGASLAGSAAEAGAVAARGSRAAELLQALTPGGMSLRAGQALQRGTTGLATRLGASEGVANFAGALGRGVGEGAVQGAALEIADAQMMDDPLTAEAVVSGASQGALWGLAGEAVVGGISTGVRYLRNRLGRTVRMPDPGSELVMSDDLAALPDAPPTRAEVYEAAQRVRDGRFRETDNAIIRGFNEVGGLSAGEDARLLNVMSTKEAAEAIVEGEAGAIRLAQGLETELKEIDSLSTGLAAESRRAMSSDLDVLPSAIPESAEVLNNIRSTVSDALEGTSKYMYGNREALAPLRAQLDDFSRRLGGDVDAMTRQVRYASEGSISNSEIYKALQDLRRSAETLELPAGSAEQSLATRIATQLDEALDQPMWGEMGPARTAYKAAKKEVEDLRFELMQQLGRKHGKAMEFDREKIVSRFKATSLADENLDPIQDVFTRYLAANANLAQTATKLFGASDEMAASLGTAVRNSQTTFEQNARTWAYLRRINQFISKENKFSGAGALLGFGTALGVNEMTDNPLLGAGAGYLASFLSRPAARIAKMAHMRAAMQRFTARLTANENKLTAALAKGGRLMKQGAQGRRVVPAMVVKLDNLETRREEYQRLRGEIDQVITNPQVMLDRMAKATQNVDMMSDTFGQDVRLTMARAIQYMAQNLPPQVMDPLQPDRPASEPSRGEMDQTINRMRVIEDPLCVYDDLVEGRLTHESAECLRQVYPQVFARMAVSVSSAMMRSGKTNQISYQARVHLNTLLGVNTHPSLQPDFIRALQGNFAQTTAQSTAIGQQRRSSARAAQVSKGTLTRAQAFEQNF